MLITKRSLLLHPGSLLAATPCLFGQAPNTAPSITVDDVVKDLPREELKKLRKSKDSAEVDALGKTLTDGLRQKWMGKQVVLEFKSREVAQSKGAGGVLSGRWFVWSEHLDAGKGADAVEVTIAAPLEGAVMAKGQAIRTGSKVILTGMITGLVLSMHPANGRPLMTLTLKADDLVKAK